jgi:hypothetical protein
MSVKMDDTRSLMHFIRVEYSAAPNDPKYRKRADVHRYQSQDHAAHDL